MPAAYAHRRFGADVLARLPAAARTPIERYRELYDIGLHGPDIFFYYHALRSNPVSKMGFAMHDEPGRVFFSEAHRRLARAQDPEAALAYLLGFVCHFSLDSTCHPYIEQYIRDSGVSHCEIETEFDTALMRQDGRDPARFFAASHIHPSAENAAVIAPFFDGVTPQQTEEALEGMVQVHHLLQMTSPLKRSVVLGGMRLVGKYDSLHGLVANAQPNSACGQSTARLKELYQQALPLAQRLILTYPQDGAQDSAYHHTFGED